MAPNSGTTSAVKRLFEPLRKSEGSWPEPEKSAGEFLQTLGRLRCWEAEGSAREAFNHFAEEVKEYLHHVSDPVSSTVTWSLYMTGRTKSSSRPTVAFVSAEANARRQIRKLIEGSGLLQKYPGFVLMDCNRPPGFRTLISLGSGDPCGTLPSATVTHNVELHIPHSQFFAIKISVYGLESGTGLPLRAAGGAVLKWNGRAFLTTAGHVFHNDARTIFPSSSNLEEFEFDIEGDDFAFNDDDEDEDDDDQSVSTSRGSRTPEISWSDLNTEPPELLSLPSSSSILSQLSHQSAVTALHIPQQRDDGHDQQDVITMSETSSVSNLLSSSYCTQASSLCSEDVCQLKGPFYNTATGSNALLDYGLIEVPSRVTGLISERKGLSDSSLEADPVVAAYPRPTNDIILLSAMSGPIKGRLSGTPTVALSSQTGFCRELWTIYLDGELTKGDCGALVVHATSGVIYGHLIAGSCGTGTGLIVPFKDIIHDLQQNFSGEWQVASISLPSRLLGEDYCSRGDQKTKNLENSGGIGAEVSLENPGDGRGHVLSGDEIQANNPDAAIPQKSVGSQASETPSKSGQSFGLTRWLFDNPDSGSTILSDLFL